MNRRWMAGVAIILILIIIVGYTKMNRPNSIESAMTRANIPYKTIIHIERLEGAGKVLVFYKQTHVKGLNIGLLDQDWFGYMWIFGSGVAAFHSQNDLTAGYSDLSNAGYGHFPVVYGVVSNLKVKKITVDGKPAKIITANGDSRIWYVQAGDKWSATRIHINGYSESGKRIIRTGV